MKVTVTERAIQFDGDVDSAIKTRGLVAEATIVDSVMNQISEQTGDKWGAVKLSGAWIISCVPAGSENTKNWNPVYGHRGENTRKFTKALANAMGKAVVQTVPFK